MTGASPVSSSPEPKNITADNPASDSTPLYSPDGKYIAYRAQKRPGYEADRFDLILRDRKTGQKRSLTESIARWVGTFIWAPDSTGIYFVAEDKGESPINSMTFKTEIIGGDPGDDVTIRNTIINISSLGREFNDDVAATTGGNALVFTRMGIQAPNEVFRATFAHDELSDDACKKELSAQRTDGDVRGLPSQN